MQVYHDDSVGGSTSKCSKLCQCLVNASVICQSLPCTDGLQCTHRNNVYG